MAMYSVPHYCPECGEWRHVRMAQKTAKQPIKPCRQHMTKRQPTIGKRTPTTNGYVLVRVGPGRAGLVYEHRHVWAEANGPIPEGFHVHHINGDKVDNRIENLELRDGREHVSEHSLANHAAGRIDNRGPKSARWRHDIDAAYILRRRAEGASLRRIASELGTNHTTVRTHLAAAEQEAL